MNVDMDQLLAIIGELEVSRRVLVLRVAELEKAQAKAAPKEHGSQKA